MRLQTSVEQRWRICFLNSVFGYAFRRLGADLKNNESASLRVSQQHLERLLWLRWWTKRLCKNVGVAEMMSEATVQKCITQCRVELWNVPEVYWVNSHSAVWMNEDGLVSNWTLTSCQTHRRRGRGKTSVWMSEKKRKEKKERKTEKKRKKEQVLCEWVNRTRRANAQTTHNQV